MKHFVATTLALLMMATSIFAAEVKSGLQAGADIGAFYVTKVAGAEADGVKTKANLCYRCKNGKRPQVMVFTRSSDDNVVNLIDQLDAAIVKNESKRNVGRSKPRKREMQPRRLQAERWLVPSGRWKKAHFVQTAAMAIIGYRDAPKICGSPMSS